MPLLKPGDGQELRAWWSVVWPACVSTLLFILMDVTDEAMLGHYKHGDLLPAASSAVLIIGLTSALFQRGPCSAVNTLSANAYGAGQTELAGRRLQLGLTMTMLLGCFMAPIWCLAGEILNSVSSSAVDVREIDTFDRWRLIGIAPNCGFWVLKAWLQGRKVTTPSMCAALLGFVLNLVLNYVLIFGCFGWAGLGFIGAPISTAISRWAMFLMLAHLGMSEIKTCWPSNWRPSFSSSRMREFLKLCIPLTLSGVLEEFNMQLTAVFALHFGPQELATHNVMLTAFLLLSTVMMGCADGTSTRVSHYLVAGDVAKMTRLVFLAFCIMISWSFFVMVSFMLLQDRIGMFFSENREVWRLSGQLSFLVGSAYALMSFFWVALAVLEGIARPTIVVVGFVLGSYCVGLPMTYVFGFKASPKAFAWWPYFDPSTASGQDATGLGVLGLWLGLTCGYLVVTAVASSRLLCMNWASEVVRARAMAELHTAEEPLTVSLAANCGEADEAPSPSLISESNASPAISKHDG